MINQKIFKYSILRCLNKDTNGGICVSDISKNTGISPQMTKVMLKKLIKEKKIDCKIGKTHNNYSTKFYFLKSDGDFNSANI